MVNLSCVCNLFEKTHSLFFTWPLLRGGLNSKMGKNCLGEVVKEAFSSGVETTLLCEQVTIGVTSFGELLNQRRSQRHPKQKRDLYSTECIRESQKNKPRREAPRRNIIESKHTEAAPPSGLGGGVGYLDGSKGSMR